MGVHRCFAGCWRAGAVALAFAGAALAQSSGGGFVLTRESIAGGGVRAEGGDLVLEATLSQAAPGISGGGGFVLVGGFQVPSSAVESPGSEIFGDGFEAGD